MGFAHLKIAELQYIYFFLSLVRWVITLAEDIFNLLALYQSSNQKNRNPLKHIKHLLFLSILGSLVLFNACGEDDANAIEAVQ